MKCPSLNLADQNETLLNKLFDIEVVIMVAKVSSNAFSIKKRTSSEMEEQNKIQPPKISSQKCPKEHNKQNPLVMRVSSSGYNPNAKGGSRPRP